MPRPGVPNNPQGVNSWEGLGNEVPYGEMTRQQALKQGAPLAGGKLAAGAINAPKRAQRQTQAKPAPVEQQPVVPPDAVPGLPSPPDPALVWAQVAALPGADQYPILALMASRSQPVAE